MTLPFVTAMSIVEPPPTPVLHQLLPSGYWARKHWPDPRWTSGRDFSLFIGGVNFIRGETVVLLGQKTLAGDCLSRGLIQVWIVPPDEPVILPVRVRTGVVASNSLPFCFFETPPC